MQPFGSLYGHRGRKKLPLRARDMRAMRTVMRRLMRHIDGIWTWTWQVPTILPPPGEKGSSTPDLSGNRRSQIQMDGFPVNQDLDSILLLACLARCAAMGWPSKPPISVCRKILGNRCHLVPIARIRRIQWRSEMSRLALLICWLPSYPRRTEFH